MSILRRPVRRLSGGQGGFTLIELMIVIVVMLLLAAILVPQFSFARERARKASCVTNQRNIETAVAMWSTDNNATVIYSGNTMDLSTPGYAQLTSPQQYAPVRAFAEPDDPAAGNAQGQDYYLSAGSPTGQIGSVGSPSYGHVACAYDPVTDPWVANYDPVGAAVGINHTRGATASP
jgi:prepilin-type N-terminal cleavage/methylation domain-containing protein